jgi:hypothetical protein
LVLTEWVSFKYRKTNIAKFTPSYCQNESFQITYQNKVTPATNNIKFLGLELDVNITALKMIYFVYFHAVMEYAVILWENLVESQRVFQQQKKRMIRIMTVSSSRTACKLLFQKLEILTLSFQYYP